ncbi:hypothetical protein PG989_012188 [Apiospora arundinis]
MEQHPLAPQRFKRPANWNVSIELVHDLNNPRHCRDCARCQADLKKRDQDEARRIQEESEAATKLHQVIDPNHRETCSKCQAIWDRHTSYRLKDARKEGVKASHAARTEWRVPTEIGLRTYRAFRAPNPRASGVLLLLPGKASPVSPTRSPSPEVAADASRPTPARSSEENQESAPANGQTQRIDSQRPDPQETLQQSVSQETLQQPVSQETLQQSVLRGTSQRSAIQNTAYSSNLVSFRPEETRYYPKRFVSSLHPDSLAARRPARTTPLVFSAPRTANAGPTSGIRRSVAESNSEQSSRKRSRRDLEQDGSEATDSTSPPPIRRRIALNLLPLGTRTGDKSQHPSRKRDHGEFEEDDLELFQFPTGPRMPGQFSPGPLFIQGPEAAVSTNHSSQGGNNKSRAMSMFDALSNLAGKAIWTAASTIGRRIGYAPTNNAGQEIVPDEGRQSPKRRRTDEASAPGPSSNVQIEVNSEHDPMELSSSSVNGMVNGGEMPIPSLSNSPYARSPLSSSASNAARKALSRYPRNNRPILEPRRRIPKTRTNDLSEPATDDSLETTQEQIMPGSWVSELDEQTWTQSSDLSTTTASSLSKWETSSETYNKNSLRQETHVRGQKSPTSSAALHGQPPTHVRGTWVTSTQPKHSPAEVSEQTSSPESNRSEQSEGNTTRNGGVINTTGRCDPEPRFKKRIDFFQSDEDLLNARINKLHLRPDDGKIKELLSQQEERKRIEREKIAAEEKAREEERLRLEAEKWNAQLRGLGLRKAKRKWITELSEEWEQRVDDSMRKSNVTCAPPEAVTMTPRDFNRMIPAGQWLNDSCVQAALTELATAVNKSAGRVLKQDTPKCVALGTFFWTTLRDKGPENKERMMKRTWGMTPLNFLDIDTIIMPINESSHWTFILIRPKRREVAYVDSFGSSGVHKLQKALGFIEVFLGPARWNPKEWKVLKDLHVPAQHNSWDCGVFVITNSIYIALGLDPNTYNEADLILQRRKIAAVLLNGGFKGDFDLGDL